MPVRKSNPFSLAQAVSKVAETPIDDEFDFDRRSAGERFQTYKTGRKKHGITTAYDEFMKVNDLFSGTGIKMMRRKSCSKSQSTSRVRGLVNSKHQPVKDNFFEDDDTPNAQAIHPWRLLSKLNKHGGGLFKISSDNHLDAFK